MHFCHEELFALLALLPGLGYLVSRLRIWWHGRHRCHHQEAVHGREDQADPTRQEEMPG